MTAICSIQGCTETAVCRSWCEGHYGRWKRHGDPVVDKRPTPETIERRFWGNVRKSSDKNICWPWSCSVDRDGYGETVRRIHGVIVRKAHRIAYAYFYKKTPTASVLHSCDNPSCCNPHHLREGDAFDNARDKVARNRQPIGERQPRSKLTDDIVRVMRASPLSAAELGRQYGVSQGVAYKAKHRKAWKHVE